MRLEGSETMFGMDIHSIKEGDLYKTVTAGGHTFELCYGYYEDYERERGEPVVIYPDLKNEPVHSGEGYRLVTAVQDICPMFAPREAGCEEAVCSDCIYYPDSKAHIDICTCEQNRKL